VIRARKIGTNITRLGSGGCTSDNKTYINPTMLFEVLSESTESYDRGGKFRQYREIDSLKEYVMISQDRASVECYLRQAGDRWLLRGTAE